MIKKCFMSSYFSSALFKYPIVLFFVLKEHLFIFRYNQCCPVT